jgi:excisionase family DNA binding protein
MTPSPGPALLNVGGAAEYLAVSEHYVRRLVRERRVEFVKVGRYVRFERDALDALIAQGRRAPIA